MTSPGETHYDYYFRLARAFSEGRLYLKENPPWLNELVPFNGKSFVVYPPMPAILLMPMVAIFGLDSTQTLLSIFLGSVDVCLSFLVLRKARLSIQTSLLVSVFFGLGTNLWYLSSVGSAWFIAHVVALFFILLALFETFGKQRILLIGLLIGASFWSRTTTIFTLPFFIIFLWKKLIPNSSRNIWNIFFLLFGVGSFVIIDGFYNFIRFGDFSAFAPYLLIPNFKQDPAYKDGLMSIKFIPRHLKAVLFKLPYTSNTFPFLVPSIYSLALWFTSPLIVYAFKFKKNLLSIACWAGILPTLLVIMMWTVVGYAQFGYRFAQDFMPLLLILIAQGIGNKPSKIAYLLLFISIVINAWGVVMINKLGIFRM